MRGESAQLDRSNAHLSRANRSCEIIEQVIFHLRASCSSNLILVITSNLAMLARQELRTIVQKQKFFPRIGVQCYSVGRDLLAFENKIVSSACFSPNDLDTELVQKERTRRDIISSSIELSIPIVSTRTVP